MKVRTRDLRSVDRKLMRRMLLLSEIIPVGKDTDQTLPRKTRHSCTGLWKHKFCFPFPSLWLMSQ